MSRKVVSSTVIRLVPLLALLLVATACSSDGSPSPSVPTSAVPTATIAVGRSLPEFDVTQADRLVGDGEVFVAVQGRTARVRSATGASLPSFEYGGDVCVVGVHASGSDRQIVVAAVSEVTGKDENGLDRVTVHLVAHDVRSGQVVADQAVGGEVSGALGHCNTRDSRPARLDFSLDGRYALLAAVPASQGGALFDLATGAVSTTDLGIDGSVQALVGSYLLRAAAGATAIDIVDPASGADGPALATVGSGAPFDQLFCDRADRCVDADRQTTASGDLVLTAPTGIQVGVPVPYAFPAARPRYPVPAGDGTVVQTTGDQIIVEPATNTVVAMGLQPGGQATFVAYDATSGKQLWDIPTAGFVDFCAAAHGGVLAEVGDHLVLVDPRTGARSPAGDDRNCPFDLGGGFGYNRDEKRVQRYF